jgi:hypothetical protein
LYQFKFVGVPQALSANTISKKYTQGLGSSEILSKASGDSFLVDM